MVLLLLLLYLYATDTATDVAKALTDIPDTPTASAIIAAIAASTAPSGPDTTTTTTAVTVAAATIIATYIILKIIRDKTITPQVTNPVLVSDTHSANQELQPWKTTTLAWFTLQCRAGQVTQLVQACGSHKS